jgi:hypothetical protein
MLKNQFQESNVSKMNNNIYHGHVGKVVVAPLLLEMMEYGECHYVAADVLDDSGRNYYHKKKMMAQQHYYYYYYYATTKRHRMVPISLSIGEEAVLPQYRSGNGSA